MTCRCLILPVATLALMPLSSAGARPAPAPAAAPVTAKDLTPEMLGDALSCGSAAAAQAFVDTLFLDPVPPDWMHEAKDDEDTEGMAGLYGYTLAAPVSLRGEPVERAYFLDGWVVTLWPRAKAEAFIAAQGLRRAPIAITEQYYRFLDPQTGPMLGVFAPTNDAVGVVLAGALGAKPPPSTPAGKLFVGCNYTPVSEAAFLAIARRSAAIATEASRHIADDIRAIAPPK